MPGLQGQCCGIFLSGADWWSGCEVVAMFLPGKHLSCLAAVGVCEAF